MTIKELHDWQQIVDFNYEMNYIALREDECYRELPPNLK